MWQEGGPIVGRMKEESDLEAGAQTNSQKSAEGKDKADASVCELIQQLDAKWQKRFDALVELSMQKRDKPTSGSELDSKPAVALKKQQTEDTAHPGTSHDLSDADSSNNNPDVLVVREEGKLDEDEDKLYRSLENVSRGQVDRQCM